MMDVQTDILRDVRMVVWKVYQLVAVMAAQMAATKVDSLVYLPAEKKEDSSVGMMVNYLAVL